MIASPPARLLRVVLPPASPCASSAPGLRGRLGTRQSRRLKTYGPSNVCVRRQGASRRRHHEKKAALTVTTGQDAITSEAGGRYARALFDLADEAGVLDAAEADMAALDAALTGSHELTRAMASPVHKTADKVAALDALSAALNFHDLTRRFVAVAAGNGRAGGLRDMARAFAALAAKRRGAITADVASVDALSAAQLKDLSRALKTALGKDVEIRAEVRPDMIGGLIVKVGSRLFDSSLSTQLEGLRKTLKEA